MDKTSPLAPKNPSPAYICPFDRACSYLDTAAKVSNAGGVVVSYLEWVGTGTFLFILG